MTDRLSEKLGQPIVIENRAGAAGNVGADVVFQSDPDGYTMLAAPAPPLVINRLLYAKLNYDSTKFVPVTVMGAILSITIATESGVRSLPPIYLRAGRTMGAEGFALYRDVILPAALPYIVSGMKQGWSFAWRSLMAGELLYVNLGLGQLLMIGRELNNMSQVVAVMIVIILIGVAVDRGVFARVEHRLRRQWGLVV
jgi:NitT/TauT family transport system permease protein